MLLFNEVSIADIENRGRRKVIPNYPEGIYLIFNEANQVVYVGSGKIRDRLYDHVIRNRTNRKNHYKFARYAIVERPDVLECTLIKALRPRFNQKYNERYFQP